MSVLSILPSLFSGGFFPIASVLFVIAMVLFGGASFVLLYHWRTYGISNRQVIFAEATYLTVSVILIIFSLISLNYI